MNDQRLTIGLTIAALFGICWIVLASLTGYGTGLLGTVCGLVIGLILRLLAGQGHNVAGPLGGVVAFVAVFLAVCFAPRTESPRKSADELVSDEAMVASMAEQIAEEWTMEGREIPWPEGSNARTAKERADFPPLLWQSAVRQWQMAPPAVKERCRKKRKQHLQLSSRDSTSDRYGWAWKGLGWSLLAGIVAAAVCVIGSE